MPANYNYGEPLHSWLRFPSASGVLPCTLASQSPLLTLKQLRPWLGFPGFFFLFSLKDKFLKFTHRAQRPAGPAPWPLPGDQRRRVAKLGGRC